MYQAQYMQKDIKNGHELNEEKKSKSHHSGLGKHWFLKNYKQIFNLGYIPFNGTKRPIPRYFEKLGHKHWCHYNDKSVFLHHENGRRLYSPFKENEADPALAELYSQYIEKKKSYIKEKEVNWQITVENHMSSGEEPDFWKSLKNQKYDLKNKNQQEKF